MSRRIFLFAVGILLALGGASSNAAQPGQNLAQMRPANPPGVQPPIPQPQPTPPPAVKPPQPMAPGAGLKAPSPQDASQYGSRLRSRNIGTRRARCARQASNQGLSGPAHQSYTNDCIFAR